MSIKQHIPNAITCGNLVSGCMSILFIACGMPVKAAVMIFVAGLFDFFDGFAARLLHAKSAIGADLDSLADVVSSGVAPGFIMYWMMVHAADLPDVSWLGISVLPCLAFLLPVFSAIRLAKFNNDDTQKTSFRGLPAPGMAIFVPSGASHRRRFGLLGMPRHHFSVLVHDGEPPAFLLVQDEIGKMDRQRGALDLPYHSRGCRGRLPLGGPAFRHGAIHVAFGVFC